MHNTSVPIPPLWSGTIKLVVASVCLVLSELISFLFPPLGITIVQILYVSRSVCSVPSICWSREWYYPFRFSPLIIDIVRILYQSVLINYHLWWPERYYLFPFFPLFLPLNCARNSQYWIEIERHECIIYVYIGVNYPNWLSRLLI